MKYITAEEFESRRLTVIDEVEAPGEPVLVTKHGKPVVKLIPAKVAGDSIFGYMAGQKS